MTEMHEAIRSSLRPDPVITMTSASTSEFRFPVGIAFAVEDAEMLFGNLPPIPEFLCLCVKVPMCKYCNNVQEAVAFFNDECWR
jgi:hypothetical protein